MPILQQQRIGIAVSRIQKMAAEAIALLAVRRSQNPELNLILTRCILHLSDVD